MPAPSLLLGPLPRLPAPVDELARRWAGAPGRVRLLVHATVLGLLLAAAGGGLLRGPWGPPVPVLVSVRDVAAGAPLSPVDTVVVQRPRDLVPPGALTTTAELPLDALAVGPLPTGVVVTRAHLTAGGPVGLATAGTAVVPVDAALLPPLPVGARLDVAVPTVDGGSTVAASGAELVADDGTWRWLRVGRDEVPAVAAGISDGRLVAAVLPPREPTGAP